LKTNICVMILERPLTKHKGTTKEATGGEIYG